MPIGLLKAQLQPNTINITTFYDLKKIYDERRASMLLGRGIEIKSDDPAFEKIFRKLDKTNKLDDLFATYMQVAAGWGVVYVTVGKNEEGDWILDYANPNWINLVKDINLNVFGGKVRKTKFIAQIPYHMDEFYKSDGTVTRKFFIDVEQVNAGGWYDDAKVPAEFKLPETEKYPFVPLYKFIFKPMRNLQTSNDYSICREDWHVRHIPALVNLIFQQIYKHVIMSKDRIIGNVAKKWIQDAQNSGNALGAFINDMVVTTNATPNGTGKQVEIQFANPQIVAYMEGVRLALAEYQRGRNHSPIDDSSAQQTEAETLFTKSLDIESNKILKKRFTEFLTTILDDIFTNEGIMTGEEEARPYALELRENVIYNEVQLTTNLVEQINNKLITHTEAIAKIRDIGDDKAKEIYELIKKEAEEEEVALQNQLSQIEQEQEQERESDVGNRFSISED